MKARIGQKTNWPVVILLILGLSTIIFPLYMAIVIAFKQPSEMTNSISGILSLPSSWSLSNFAEAWKSPTSGTPLQQYYDHRCDCCTLYPDPLSDGLCDRTEPCTQ